MFIDFDGIIFVKNGYWKGSVYSFKLVLGNIIAEKNRFKPYIQITSKSLPFHPLVHPENGKIANLTDNSNLGTLEKLIDNLYKIFETPLNLLIAQAEYILNEEALSVFSMNVEEFKKIANENVKLSLEELNENMKKEQL